MSRISNNSFSVNSNLEQIVEVSGGTITPSGTQDVDVVGNTVGLSTGANQSLQLAQETVTASNTSSIDNKLTVGSDDSLASSLQVLTYGRKDATPSGLRALKCDFEGRLMVDIDRDSVGLATEASLQLVDANISNIDGKITQGSDAALTNAQQVLIYGRDSGGGLDALQVNGSGELIVTSGSSTHSGSQANLMNAVSATNGTNSNVITTTSSSLINIFGNTSGSGGVTVQQSADNSNFYDVGFSVFPDGNGDFSASFHQPSNYWRIQATETATITATLIHNA